MAVIINDMDMPESCFNCDLHNYHFCDLTGNCIEQNYDDGTREVDCPLMPYKSCNDPVDRKKVLDILLTNWEVFNGDDAMQNGIDDIKALPSVKPVACIAEVRFDEDKLKKIVKETAEKMAEEWPSKIQKHISEQESWLKGD